MENLDLLTGTNISSTEELPNAPHVTVNAELQKTWQLGSDRLILGGNAKWLGARKLNLIDNPATDETSYYTANARVSFGPDSGRWEVALFSQNVTNQIYRIVATPFAGFDGSVIEIYGPPRTFGGSVRVHF